MPRKAKTTAAAPKQRPYVVKSLGQVAEFFDVAVQTVKEWRKDRSMPRPNAWPLDEIARWKIAKSQRPDRPEEGDKKPTSKDVVADRRAQLLDIEIAKQRGRYVDFDFVARLLERHITVHNTLTEDLKERVVSLLPKQVNGEGRKRISAGVDKAISEFRFAMAAAVEEWSTGDEDEGDED